MFLKRPCVANNSVEGSRNGMYSSIQSKQGNRAPFSHATNLMLSALPSVHAVAEPK